MDRAKYRVWCKNKNEYEKDDCMLATDGRLFQNGAYGSMQPLSLDNHVIELCTGLKDKNGVLIFEGDIVEYNANKSPIHEEPKYIKSPVYLHELRNCYAVKYSEFANADLWRYVRQGKNEVEVTGNIHD